MGTQQVLIIGGGVLGPKVGCRLKRLRPEWEVTLIDQQEDIAYSACGIPQYIAGDVAELEGLMTASFHMVRNPDFFENAKDVRIKTRTQALSLDRQAQRVRVRYLVSGEEEELPYDKLVLATGRRPRTLAVPGADLPGVTSVVTLEQVQAVKERISRGEVDQAVVVGAGPGGCELAAAVSDLWGVETTLVEPGPRVLPDRLDSPLARMVHHHLEFKGVEVVLQEAVREIRPGTGDHSLEVVTSNRLLPADLVIVALGAEPNSDLAARAGLTVSPGGGIVINHRLQTSDPQIYAGGGCVENLQIITGKPAYFPEPSLAHRQGRVIGTNIAGEFATFPGITGSYTFKVFDLAVAGTGLHLEAARQEGLDADAALVVQQDHAHYYPVQELIYLQLVVDRKSRRLLGAQGICHNGDALVGRINSIAALLLQRGTIEDLSNLEMAYSPPFGTALDIVNTVANTAENIVEGRNRSIGLAEFQRLFLEAREGALVLDVRGAANAAPFVAHFGERWRNLPQETLKHRFNEVPRDQRLILICNAGMRSYEALRQLQTHGFDNAVGLQGGVAALKKSGMLDLG
ncbi:MAG: FAD-dependent oxidoreductase [Syntrophobacterales bacterium]|jgi:NADPH-dependent 2,4-dienoyl-CoA reductase/sulfur reductase-like enzyme/rhodanese-related sulfurtransferase